MRLTRLLEALVLLDESKKVDEMVSAILSKEIGDSGLVSKVMDGIKALDQVKRSPNGRDAIPVAKWVVSCRGLSLIDAPDAVEKLLDRKDKLGTTKNIPLNKLSDMFPTYGEFEDFLDDESEKVVNGYKDATLDDIDVEELSDEERSKLIRKEFGKPTLSVPGKVDVYRADNKRQSILYSKGYTWCIGYTTADNQFDHYRNIGNGTAYFCFFRKPQKGYRDVACVIHAMDNNEYRMTDADNNNGSPVVNKETVLENYPDLAPVIDKMVVVKKEETPLDVELNRYESDEPLPLDFLCNTDDVEEALEYGWVKFSRKDIRQLLMKDVMLSNELFEFILKYFEHGKVDPADKDNLIGIYLRLAKYPLTREQRELIKDSTQLLRYYDNLFRSKLLSKQRAEFEEVSKELEDDGDDDDKLYLLSSDYHFFTDLPDVRLDTEAGVYVQPECDSLSGLPYGALGDTYLEVVNNHYIESIRDDEINGYSHVYIEKCSNLRIVEVQQPNNLSVTDCGKVERIMIHSDPSDFWVDDVYVKNLPSLTSLEFYNIEKLDYLKIEKCPRLNPNTILEAIRDVEIGELDIDGEIVDIDGSDDDTDEADE